MAAMEIETEQQDTGMAGVDAPDAEQQDLVREGEWLIDRSTGVIVRNLHSLVGEYPAGLPPGNRTGMTAISNPNLVTVTFDRFDLASYELFLRAKALPEKRVEYDREADRYTLTTHRRFASRLAGCEDAEPDRTLAVKEFLFDYQRFIVERAVAAERFAIWCDTGLGKTPMALECMRQVLQRMGGKVLELTYKSIIPQTMEASLRWYPELGMRRLETREELIAWLMDGQPGAAITNYEKLIPGVIPEFRYLSGLVLDESGALKTAAGVIKWNLIKSAKGIPYKFAFSATPAPNDVAEYASQAAFLEKIQGFWDYFSKGADGKGDWYIKPHAQEAFYRFMAAWSIYMRSPARFGFADNLADLPEPVFHDIAIPATDEQFNIAQRLFTSSGSGLFGDRALGVTQRAKLSQAARGFLYDKRAPGGAIRVDSRKPAVVASIVADCVRAQRQVLVWTAYDEESRIITEALAKHPEVVFENLHGATPEDKRAAILEAFRSGAVRVLVSKARLLGFGMNFQFCTAMVFSGIGDSYEEYYQAVRRAYRYGQTESVQIYMPIVTELEGPILENLMKKRAGFEADTAAQEAAFVEILRGGKGAVNV